MVSGASPGRGEQVVFFNDGVSTASVFSPRARVEVANQASVHGSLVGHEVRLSNYTSVKRKTAVTNTPALQCPVEVVP